MVLLFLVGAVLPCDQSLLYWGGKGRIGVGELTNDGNCETISHLDDCQSGLDGLDIYAKKITAQDHGSRGLHLLLSFRAFSKTYGLQILPLRTSGNS